MAAKNLRAVADGEVAPKPAAPPTLLEAVESGDMLAMLLAQRRLIAEGLTKAGDSTRPQLNNELNKLHALIEAEQARRAAKEAVVDGDRADDEAFDASAV